MNQNLVARFEVALIRLERCIERLEGLPTQAPHGVAPEGRLDAAAISKEQEEIEKIIRSWKQPDD